MTALSFKNEKLYHRMGRKEIGLQEFTASIKDLPLWTGSQRDGFWWAALLYLGAFGKEPTENLELEFGKLGAWDSPGKDKAAFEHELRRFSEAYGDWGDALGGVFCRIYEILEGLKTFAES